MKYCNPMNVIQYPMLLNKKVFTAESLSSSWDFMIAKHYGLHVETKDVK